jgi:DNA-binding CsgD family transcriptional regulator/pimeloyl-ACP methyl ester carboxylesterase
MVEPPETRYVEGPRGALAYQVLGSGPPDLVVVPGMHSHLDLQWHLLGYRRFVRGIARSCRLIRYDKLGTGLSDPTSRPPTQEERIEDLRLVVESCARDPVVVLGFSEGGPLAISYAVQHGVAALILYGTSIRAPYGAYLERLEQVLAGWGSGQSLDVFAPSMADDAGARQLTASIERAAASPAMARHVIAALATMDATDLLGMVRVPTLVLHRSDEFIPVDEARTIAAGIIGARLTVLPGVDHQPWAGDVDAVVSAVASFVAEVPGGERRQEPSVARTARPVFGWPSLTAGERRVAGLAADGLSNPQIARQLHLSRATVETHLKRVYAKLSIEGRHQLAVVRGSR